MGLGQTGQQKEEEEKEAGREEEKEEAQKDSKKVSEQVGGVAEDTVRRLGPEDCPRRQRESHRGNNPGGEKKGV